MSFDKKAYQREYMKKKRASGIKEAVVDDATHGTREDLQNLTGGTCAGGRKACRETSATHTGSETQADQSSQTNLPVDVQPEPLQASDVEPGNTTQTRSGEARDSTPDEGGLRTSSNADTQSVSRGRQKLPKGIDPKEWAYACERAERAKRYAEKMPEFVKPADLVFQDPMWQWENQVRGRFGGIVGGSLSGSRNNEGGKI